MAATLPQTHHKTLKNGLEVVAIPLENGSGVISVDIIYRVGSRNEIMGKSGLAHMLEHMNFKSTKNLESGEFDRVVKSLGGVTNASTGFDYTRYFIKTSTRNLDKSLSLFAEMMEHLSLKDKEFQPERDVVAEERRWRTDNNPMGFLFFSLFNTAYTYHPYHWTPIGFMNDIQTWTIDDLKDFHKTWYQPQNAVLIVAGDLKPEDLFKAAEKHFAKVKNRSDLPEIKADEPEQFGPRRAVIYKESEVEMLAMAWRVPPYDHEDGVALSALGSLLSDGQSSRLQEKLIDQKRLVNSISAFSMDLKDPGLFVVMAVCNPGVKAETVEALILEEIDAIKKKAPPKREVEKVKTGARAEFIYALESSDSVSRMFGDYLARGNLQPLLDYEKEVEALSGESLQAMAKKYLNEKTSTTLILRKGN